MGLFRKTPLPVEVVKPNSIVAAAVNLSENPVAWRARVGEDSWQKDAWYFYDAVGELRFVMNWIANAVSLARMYVAETDPDTGQPTGPTENAVAQKVLDGIFGGAAKRSQAQMTMALNYSVAGEFFILVRPGQGPKNADEWYVLSSTEVEERGGAFKYCDPMTGRMIEMNPSRDLFIRQWSPHPRKQSHSDSPVRAALPILREIERTSMNIMSRLDSRLAGAGLLVIPKELDFPGGPGIPEGPQGVMQAFRMAAEASLRNPGEASAQVPIIMDAPGEQVANFNHIDFTTELTNEVLELRTAAIKRLASALDVPAEILEGMSGANHWSAWQIEEAGYKIHIAPLLDRIADALTTRYLQPTLENMRVPDFDQYVIKFDVSEMVSRPNRQAEMIELYDRILISDEALRTESGVPDSDIPSDDEHNRRFVESLVEKDTSLLSDPGVRQILGLEEITVAQPQETVSQPEVEQDDRNTREIPERATEPDSDTDNGITAAAELMVFDALSRAGGRLLTREHRGQYGSTPKHELHTVLSHKPARVILEGSFQFADMVAETFNVDAPTLRRRLNAYCTHLISEQIVHNREEMQRWLAR